MAIISIAQCFFFIFNLLLFEYIAQSTETYAYKDWVVPKERQNHDGEDTSSPIVAPVILKARERLLSNARHRADTARYKDMITLEYIIAWFGILILVGVYAGGKNRRFIQNIYGRSP